MPETFEDLIKEITEQIESKARKEKILRTTGQTFRADLAKREINGMENVLGQFKAFINA